MGYNPKFVSKRTRHNICQDFELGFDNDTIAGKFRLHPYTISRYRKRYNDTGSYLSDYELSKIKNKGKPSKRDKICDDDDIKIMLLDNCTVDPIRPLTVYSDDIYAEFGIIVHPSTIGRYFNSIGWKWKRLSRIAFEVDVSEVHIFWKYVSQVYTDPKQCVWLDESYRSDLTPNSTRARGPG